MNVKQAKDIARQWVAEEAATIAGLQGAYFAGSAIWLPDHADLPVTSDVDVTLVHDGPAANLPDKPGKFLFRGVVLDVSRIPLHELRLPELILGDYHLAGSFREPNIILDRSGQLSRLTAAVSRDYAKRFWVSRRCDHAMRKIQNNLEVLDASDPLHHQVISWLFPTGVTTHVLLNAGLRNATVRQRYVAVKDLLADYGLLDFHETLLELLGCAQVSRARAEHHLDALVTLFDAVKDRATSPFPFASDISEFARPIAIDGSRNLIARGYHREAIFWIVATWSRCLAIIHADLPYLERDGHDHGFRELLGDLGIASSSDLRQRGERVKALLPAVRDVADQIMSANPDVHA